MSLTELLAHYGYLLVFVGSILEGETVLLLAGFAAHQGYLSLPVVMATAAVGGMLGDQLFFYLGRGFGPDLVARFPRIRPGAERVAGLLQRFHAPVIVGIRFMYGLRIVGPLVIGASAVSPWRFLCFNLIGALLWACLVGAAGYAFGNAMQWLMDDLRRAEETVMGGLLVAGLLLGVWRQWRRRHH